MRLSLTPVAAALGAILSCTHGAPDAGRVADAAAPPRSAFEVYPAAEVAGLESPHDYKGKALCQRCHEPSLALVKPVNALCRECHSFGHGNHPVDVVQNKAVKDLPLLAGGNLGCHTCHDPHQRKVVLRKPFNALCQSCHVGH
ncbi:MAG TPA: cytochrome c3 family protein [Anaeromyxobacter sp.]|nr:cytochrome c3 family protein [Anaeromyxobacter sp.]